MEKILRYIDFINEKENTGKKVLFISFPDKAGDVSYHDYLKSKLDCTFCDWDNLIFNEKSILLGNKDLNKFSFVFVGVVGSHPDYFVTLEKYCKENKIPQFNYGCSPERSNKIYQNSIMEMKGVPQIPTIISKCSSVNAKELINSLGLPMVSKITDGSQGKGVEIQKTSMDLERYLKKNKNKTIIFQKFIENEGDYRILFIKKDLMYVIKRKSRDAKKEFRNNVSLGGTAEKIDNLPKTAIEIAKKAAESMDFDMCGVDLIKDKNSDNWYVLEINSAPQFQFRKDKVLIVDYRDVLDKFISIINKK